MARERKGNAAFALADLLSEGARPWLLDSWLNGGTEPPQQPRPH